MTLVLGNRVQIWLARCFTSGDVFDFISLTIFQPKFFRDLWTFIVGTGLAQPDEHAAQLSERHAKLTSNL